MHLGRLALVVVAGLLAAVAGTVLTVAANAATGGTVTWFPAVERDPLWWTAGSTAAVAACGLLVWQGQRLYDAGLRVVVPEVQRPESWVVDRPAEVMEAAAAIRAGRTVGVTTAVHGTGGFGKTTIAKMVRGDPRVLRRFGGRVYWVTVGRDAGRQALTGMVNDLIKWLEPDRPVSFIDVRQAAEYLAAILGKGPRRLLVLDDVWSQEQLDVFPVAGRCARLVTTRNAYLLGGTGRTVLVDRMTERQAHAVLTAGLPGLAPVLAGKLVAEAGCWPLLLRLVNKILNDRARILSDVNAAAEELLAMLRQGHALKMDRLSGAKPAQLDVGDAGQRAWSVRLTIEASTGLLDSSERARFAELAVFAEDETVPVDLAVGLWQAAGGLREDEAYALLARLGELALLTLNASPCGGAFHLHDVIRDFLREELGQDRLRALHQVLLSSAAVRLTDTAQNSEKDTVTAWWELPEGSRYLRDHLIEHMIAAQDLQDAERTATDLRWAVARLEQSGPAGPYRDLSQIATPRARRLQRLLGQSAHLLAATDPAYSQADILYSRVNHDPDWGPTARALQSADGHPALIATRPLPDVADQALRRTLTGHDGEVQVVAIAPDGTWLATAGKHDRSVRTWDAATGQQRATLTSHDGEVQVAAIAPDGTWLAIGSEYGSIRIWDAATGQQRAALPCHDDDEVTAIAIAPDGTWLATAGKFDGSVRIWDAATRQQRATLTGHLGWAIGVVIAQDGTWLAAIATDGSVRIWDAATGQQRAALPGHDGGVTAIAVAPDGMWLATAGKFDGSVRIWDAATGQQRAALPGHDGGVSAVAIAPDGTWLATAGKHDGSVRIWDAATGQQRAMPTGRRDPVRTVAIAPDSAWLATISEYDSSVRIWDAATGQQRTLVTGHDDVTEMAIAPDGTCLAIASIDGSVWIWDAATGQQRAALVGHDGGVSAVAIAPDGTWLATAGKHDGSVRIWDAATGQQRATLAGHRRLVWGVDIAPDGTWLATGSDDGSVRIWDAATGHERATLSRYDGGVSAAAIAPDSTWLATANWSNWSSCSVRIWDAATGQQRATLSRDYRNVTAIAIAPDGTWLATADWHGSIQILDTITGRLRATLTGHASKVEAIAIAPDSAWLATVGKDRTVRVWDQATSHSLAIMRVDGPLRGCAWSQSGKSIVAVGTAGWYYFAFRS